ncbi:hypothetical protein CSOJ01_08555 [Colletotrichum sojae]|uniref:Nup53p-like protein n=1 Tax=Colletotrichum sojae TaxID=2175907 RepID=A0A8H6J695_9PEZI|nr:hypothetical protein CSOJ01_08555 [Colletotrichum sojae]
MAPLILHNVPDDELYIGDDGVKRPYAMVFPQQDGLPGARRRGAAETGSFGKSTRRSRSRTGTPARRENPTIQAADKLFGEWVSNAANSSLAANPSTDASSSNATGTQQRKPSGLSQPPLLASDEAPAANTGPLLARRREPTEVILRGYRSPSQQYAAVSHYEQLAGLICEDYPREPPLEQRRYKSELRDPAFTRRRALTPEERAKVNRADGGEHWVKVTFESADAADAAVYASPQRVLGYLVHAEPYHGLPPARDEPVPDVDSLVSLQDEHHRSQSVPAGQAAAFRRQQGRNPSSGNPFSSAGGNVRSLSDFSPPGSLASSNTIETATISNGSSATITMSDLHPQDQQQQQQQQEPLLRTEDSLFCRRIPTARRAKLLPAEQALLPQQSYSQRLVNAVPFLKWFSGSMIGNEVPRTDAGDFDWNRASLYWKVIWWLDATFGLFGGEILSADKDD